MKQSLPIGRVLRAALIVLLLNALGMTNVFADGYDYAEECPSGQTLYYKIDPDDSNAVIVVAPYYYYYNGYNAPTFEFWGGYEKPTGDVIIPETLSNGMVVKTIGKTKNVVYDGWLGAFSGTEITSVTIGNQVTFIDDGAFSSCPNLTSVTIGNAVTKIGTNNDVGLMGAFARCSNLTSVDFGQSVTLIGVRAFSECTSLANLTLPNTLTDIDYHAFSKCTSLYSITIPSSVKSICLNAFEDTGWYNSQSDGILYLDHWCLGYKGEKPTGSLVIPEGIKGVSWMAFEDCSDITSITLPSSLKIIDNAAFYECTGLTSITFPNSLVSIGESAFERCTGFTSITIPQHVTFIGYEAFNRCDRLEMVYYNPENAVTEENVFKRCTNLATISIGPDVKTIDENVFKNCNTVHLVVALGPTPAVLGAGAFSELADDAYLMVACNKKMTYFSAWSTFSLDHIVDNCDQLPISMGNVGAGGTITPSSTTAQMGEEVLLTVTPNAGMALASIAIHNANDPSQTIPYYFPGKAKTTVGFIMPSFAVSVTATFKASGASVAEDGMEVAVYPNPTNGKVRVEVDGMRSISVFNLMGQKIFKTKVSSKVLEFDFSGYGPGVYLVRIETESGIATKQVVLTK